MAQSQHQALSDLMDGELDADQAEAVLDALCRDEALAAEWHRMHRIRGLMRGDDAATFDISAAVREALANEPAYLLPAVAAPRQPSRWLRYAMGGALAASVALATVVGLRYWQAPAGAPELAAADAREAAMVPVVARGNSPETAATRQPSRLESYWAVYADNALFAGQDTLPLAHGVRVDQTQ